MLDAVGKGFVKLHCATMAITHTEEDPCQDNLLEHACFIHKIMLYLRQSDHLTCCLYSVVQTFTSYLLRVRQVGVGLITRREEMYRIPLGQTSDSTQKPR